MWKEAHHTYTSRCMWRGSPGQVVRQHPRGPSRSPWQAQCRRRRWARASPAFSINDKSTKTSSLPGPNTGAMMMPNRQVDIKNIANNIKQHQEEEEDKESLKASSKSSRLTDANTNMPSGNVPKRCWWKKWKNNSNSIINSSSKRRRRNRRRFIGEACIIWRHTRSRSW